MEIRREIGAVLNLARDWVRFVMRRISRHFQPNRTQSVTGSAPATVAEPVTDWVGLVNFSSAVLAEMLEGRRPMARSEEAIHKDRLLLV